MFSVKQIYCHFHALEASFLGSMGNFQGILCFVFMVKDVELTLACMGVLLGRKGTNIC